MSSGCGDVLSLSDLQTAKKHQLFEAEVITGKQGGVAGGTDIDYATNQVTGQTQKTLPAVLRDAGFRPASFTFTTGGTLNVGDSDVGVLWPISSGGDGDYYIWKGALPKTIPAASTPASTGGVSASAWMPIGDISLRSDLFNGNASLVGYKNNGAPAVQQTVKDKLDRIYYASDYGVLPGNTAGVNTTNLQNMLNTLSGQSTISRFIFADSGTIFVNGPITVPNNTDIEIKAGVTISGNTGNLKPVFKSEKWDYVLSNRSTGTGFATNTSDLNNRSDYIGIWGGGTVDYN